MYKVNDDLIFNEKKEYIVSLLPHSQNNIKTVCPFCGKHKKQKFANVTNAKHTFCQGCAVAVKNLNKMLGKTFGYLTVISIAPSRTNSRGENISYCKCRCSCGKEREFKAVLLRSGNTKSCGCYKDALLQQRKGEKHPSWKHDISKEERQKLTNKRRDLPAKEWRNKVKEVFGNHCFLCGSTENIVVHHVENFKNNENLRYDVQNGVCLCNACHINYHTQFLGGYQIPATKQSFKSFMEWWLCQLQNC